MGTFQDLTGSKFGEWTVLCRAENRVKTTMWHCRCSCGTEKDVSARNLKRGDSTSCGCVSGRKTSERFRKDLTGRTFGRLTVVKRIDPNYKEGRKTMYECVCSCGNKAVVSPGNLQSGAIQSCGCLRHEKCSEMNLKDITGQKFGRLTVLGMEGHRRDRVVWRCRCDCGKEIVANGNSLKRGLVQSCGCLRKDVLREKAIDLTSQTFGWLTVEKIADDIVAKSGRHYVAWDCKCVCGKHITVRGENLRSGRTTSCGCMSAHTSAKDRIGEKVMTASGLYATVIGGNTSKDLVVQFEDGIIKEHVAYNWFKKGVVCHPKWKRINPIDNQYLTFTDVHQAYRTKDAVYYYCVNKDGIADILTPQQMLATA